MTLRDYQTDAVARIRDAFRRHRRVLYQAPTGSGKTVLFGYMAEAAAARGRRVGILVHRRELMDQASRKLAAAHGLVKAGVTASPGHQIQIASVASLVRRTGRYGFDFLIVDEAHHCPAGTYRKILDAYPEAYVLGVTATPARTDGRGLDDLFDDLIVGPTVAQLQARGYLATARVYAPSRIDLDGVHTRCGDYVRSELSLAVDRPTVTGNAIEHYKRHADGLPAIAFCVSIAHAEHVAAEFQSAGYRAASVDGTMSDHERQRAIAALADGSVQVLTSCDLISEGVDVPVVACGIMLRPTKSLGLWMQQMGRVLRPAPGKRHAVILDHAGNAARLGVLPTTEIAWTLSGRNAAAKQATDPVHECPACYAVWESGTVCPECGHVLPVKPRHVEQIDGELVEVTDAALRRLRRQEQGRAGSLEALVALARERGYRNPHGWARHVWHGRQARRAEG